MLNRVRCSITVGADTNAHAGRSETDARAAIFVVAAALDVTLTRRVTIGIAGLTDDDTALAAFAPAAAVFVADHANVLNVARRHHRYVGGKRRGGSGGHQECTCPEGERDREFGHLTSPTCIGEPTGRDANCSRNRRKEQRFSSVGPNQRRASPPSAASRL